MRAITHMAASSVAAAAAWHGFRPAAGLGILVFGGLLDVDHVAHFVSSGLPAEPAALLRCFFSSEKQLEGKYDIRRKVPEGVLFPALHTMEFAAALSAAGLLLGSPFLLWGGAGVILHLLMDIGSYPCSPGFFSMAWRLCNMKQLLREWRRHRSKVRW